MRRDRDGLRDILYRRIGDDAAGPILLVTVEGGGLGVGGGGGGGGGGDGLGCG